MSKEGKTKIPFFVLLGLVVLLPLLAGGLWRITAGARYIGEEHRNAWWENLAFALLFVLAVYGAWQSVGLLFGESSGH